MRPAGVGERYLSQLGGAAAPPRLAALPPGRHRYDFQPRDVVGQVGRNGRPRPRARPGGFDESSAQAFGVRSTVLEKGRAMRRLCHGRCVTEAGMASQTCLRPYGLFSVCHKYQLATVQWAAISHRPSPAPRARAACVSEGRRMGLAQAVVVDGQRRAGRDRTSGTSPRSGGRCRGWRPGVGRSRHLPCGVLWQASGLGRRRCGGRGRAATSLGRGCRRRGSWRRTAPVAAPVSGLSSRAGNARTGGRRWWRRPCWRLLIDDRLGRGREYAAGCWSSMAKEPAGR